MTLEQAHILAELHGAKRYMLMYPWMCLNDAIKFYQYVNTK